MSTSYSSLCLNLQLLKILNTQFNNQKLLNIIDKNNNHYNNIKSLNYKYQQTLSILPMFFNKKQIQIQSTSFQDDFLNLF